MVGKVTVRGQGPVRRRQTTTTFKKGGRVKSRSSKGLRPMSTLGRTKTFEQSVEKFKDVKDAVSKKNVHQDPRSKQAAKYRHMLDNPKKMPKASPHRVKLMHGGRPSARTRHIENEKEEIRRVDRNIRRNEGYKTGGRVKKAKGGSTIRKLADTIGKDIKDSRKKLNVHQDPRSGLAASLRHMRDNPSKKKPSSPHTAAPKKRTMKDMYPRDGFKPGLMRRVPSGGPKKRPLRKLPTKKK